MTEQPKGPEQPGREDESPRDRTAEHGGRPDRVRTEGETAVDDAMGTGDNVH